MHYENTNIIYLFDSTADWYWHLVLWTSSLYPRWYIVSFLMTNVLTVSRCGQKRLLNALNVNEWRAVLSVRDINRMPRTTFTRTLQLNGPTLNTVLYCEWMKQTDAQTGDKVHLYLFCLTQTGKSFCSMVTLVCACVCFVCVRAWPCVIEQGCTVCLSQYHSF